MGGRTPVLNTRWVRRCGGPPAPAVRLTAVGDPEVRVAEVLDRTTTDLTGQLAEIPGEPV